MRWQWLTWKWQTLAENWNSASIQSCTKWYATAVLLSPFLQPKLANQSVTAADMQTMTCIADSMPITCKYRPPSHRPHTHARTPRTRTSWWQHWETHRSVRRSAVLARVCVADRCMSDCSTVAVQTNAVHMSDITHCTHALTHTNYSQLVSPLHLPCNEQNFHQLQLASTFIFSIITALPYEWCDALRHFKAFTCELTRIFTITQLQILHTLLNRSKVTTPDAAHNQIWTYGPTYIRLRAFFKLAVAN